jgi:hypothetical protein
MGLGGRTTDQLGFPVPCRFVGVNIGRTASDHATRRLTDYGITMMTYDGAVLTLPRWQSSSRQSGGAGSLAVYACC